MRTQWRMAIGMSGGQRLGIDYTSLYGHPKFARLGFDEQDKMLGQIQHIEAGALAAMNEQSHLADQEAEERHRTTEVIQHTAELNYLHEEKQRINVQELMNAMDLPQWCRGDGMFVA